MLNYLNSQLSINHFNSKSCNSTNNNMSINDHQPMSNNFISEILKDYRCIPKYLIVPILPIQVFLVKKVVEKIFLI